MPTTGYKIDVSRAGSFFDVGEHHAEFGLFKDHESPLSSFSYSGCDALDFDNPVELFDINLNDPQYSVCKSFGG